MSSQRIVVRQAAPSERKPATIAPSRASAAAPALVQRLQQRLGNEGTAALVARSSLRVSSPQDPAEREATAKAAEVMRMPSADAPPVSTGHSGAQRCACASCGCEAQRDAAGPAPVAPETSGEIRASMSGGAPLPGSVRTFLEPRFKADFSNVRVHTDRRAASLSANLNAHAFTVGNHVFFGKGQYQPETAAGKELIAHELTHTIQQGGSVQRSSAGDGMLVQREEGKSWWDGLKDIADFGEAVAWDMVRTVAPDAVPILQKGPSGVLDWIGEKIGAAADAIFNKLMAPVRAIAGVGDTLSALFAPMAAALQVAAGQIAQNDCSPIKDAAEKIEKTALKIITPIVEKLQPVVAKVKGFLNDVWDKIGAPIWNWIKEYAKEQWDQFMWLVGIVKSFYVWVWQKTAWIRDLAVKAWNWIKNKLGIGEGPEGQDGLLQWVTAKFDAAWNALKVKIEPFRKELTTIALVVGGVLLAVSPAGPILAIGAAVTGAVQGLRWIAANWGKGSLIVQARVYIQTTLIPPLLGAAKRLVAGVAHLAASIAGALGSLAAGILRAAGSLAGTVLRFAVSAIQWLADQAAALAAWANQKLGDLAMWLMGAVAKLQVFLQQILTLLSKLGSVILDIYGLPFFLGEKVWNLIPACIRDPIVDFIGPIILRQIELFSELGKDDEAWQKTKADVLQIIRLVFKDHDLVGAVKATFFLILRVFNIPPDLLVKIGRKAMAAWDVVSKKPIEFIKNTIRAIGAGFKLLWDNLWEDLKDGLQGWLFGELQDQKINPPASWTNPKDLFFLALEVLGLSVDHVWELLAKKFNPDKVAALRKRLGQAGKVLDWINNAIDLTKSPKENAQGIWDKAKDFAGTVLTGIAEWVVAKVGEELAIMAAAAAASGGLSEVLDVLRRVYKVLVTAKRYARRILDMVNQGLDSVLDIAAGNVQKVGVVVHKIMKAGMPVVIGFLAEQVGLGGVAKEVKKIIDKLRAKVDEGILWFIDKVKAGLEALIGAAKAGVAKLLQWWKKEVPLDAPEEKHTLKFIGSEANAALVVQSTTQDVNTFVNQFLTIEGTAAEIKSAQKLDNQIQATMKALVAAAKADDKAATATLTDKLNTDMEALGKILVALISRGGGDEGGEKRPLIIDYPKRRASAYQDILIGPRVGVGIRVSQKSLEAVEGTSIAEAKKQLVKLNKDLKEDNDGLKAWNNGVKRLSPMAHETVGGKQIGLSEEFRSLGPGKKLTFKDQGSTGGGHKINDLLKPYGFVPRSSGGEGLDGDHVMERQIGGPDDLINLWPLDRSENRSSGATIKSLKTTYQGKPTTIQAARETRANKEVHLVIRTTREE